MDKNLFEVIVLDTGNGNGNPYSRFVKNVSIPAIMGIYKETKQQGKGVRGYQNDVERNIYEIEEEEQAWAIGKDVYDLRLEPIQIYSRDGKQRYVQPMFKKYAKVLLAKALGDQHILTKNVFLVTTTTARDFQNAEIHKTLKKFFENVHKLRVNGETVLIPVQHYEAMSETEAIIYDLLLDEEANYADPDVLEQDILVINIGNGTTDLAHFRGCEYINDIQNPTIETAYNEVVERCAEFASEALEREITGEDIRAQLDLQYDKHEKTFNFYGEEVKGFNNMYKAALDEVFAVLIAKINPKVPDTGRFHRIVVVGGGAEEYVWAEHFKKWSPNKVEIPKNPAVAPARGAYKWGVLEVTAITEEAAAAKE